MVRTWIGDVTSLLDEERYQEYYRTVPTFRQEKADRIRFAEDKALSIGAWVLYEKMQKEYGLSVDAPFNLSHSGSCVLCSVEDSGDKTIKVGCDLEKIKEERLAVAKHFFCEEEYKYVSENKGSFYRFWVLKESFMKATRLGMKLGLKEFEIQISESGVPILKNKPEKIEGQFYFKEYVADGLPYRIAVCATHNEFAETLSMIKL